MTSLAQTPSADAVVRQRLLESFFLGGFECSTHLRRAGRRLDLIAATAHDQFALADYERLKTQGIRVAREGVRWHLVEAKSGRLDFSSVLPIVQAAQATDTQVIWDLCHFGWPEHLDILKPEFVARLAEYAAAFANWLRKIQGANRRILGGDAHDDAEGVIAAAVEDDDELEFSLVMVLEIARVIAEHRFDAPLFVIGRDEEQEAWIWHV